MGNPLLDRRSPKEWLALGQVIEFKEKIEFFDRLESALEQQFSALEDSEIPENWRKARVSGQLQFSESPSVPGAVELSVAAKADADMVCQRCLNVFRLTLETKLDLLLAGPSQDMPEQADTETWELEEPAFRPADIVDEVLVMAMPLSPMHETETCRAESSDKTTSGQEETTRPFADLRAQMDQQDSGD